MAGQWVAGEDRGTAATVGQSSVSVKKGQRRRRRPDAVAGGVAVGSAGQCGWTGVCGGRRGEDTAATEVAAVEAQSW